MKLKLMLILIALLAPVTLAQADEANSVDRLNAIAKPSGFLLDARTSTYLKASGRTKLRTGSLVSTSDISFTDETIALNYGLTEDFSLGLGAGYLFKANIETTDPISHLSTSAWREGIEDPSVLANYRFFRAQGSPVSADLRLVFSPKLMEARDASASKRGNAARGSANGQAALYIFAGSGMHDLSLSAALNHDFGGSKSTNPKSSSYTFDTYNSPEFAANYRFHPVSAIFIEPSATLHSLYKVNSTLNDYPVVSRIEAENKAYWTWGVGAGAALSSSFAADLHFYWAKQTVDYKLRTNSGSLYEYSTESDTSSAVLTLALAF